MKPKILFLGGGHRKNIEFLYNKETNYKNPKIVNIDINELCKPDILWDLTKHPLPIEDKSFDEIHAYDVLEHLAYQGDYIFFFKEFSEYWRILKKDGIFVGSVPKKESIWSIGDPSHKRIIVKENLLYLDKNFYKQCGKTKASDFRYIWKKSFKLIGLKYTEDLMYFILQKK